MSRQAAGVRRDAAGRWAVFPVGSDTVLAGLPNGWADVARLEAAGWTLTWETPADLALFEESFGLRPDPRPAVERRPT